MQAETTQAPDLTRAEARMPKWMLGIAVAGVAVSAVAGEWRAAAGFGLGAAFGILGYFWLHETVEAMLAEHRARMPRGVVAKLALRYVLMAVIVYFGYRTAWLPVLAIFAGLLVPGAGVLIESLNLLRGGFHSSPAER